MNELQQYVDTLFKHQRDTAETKDLKEEILSNMTAKRDDLLAQGVNEATAIQKAKESLLSIEGLVEGNQLTYIDRYHSDCLQSSLLACTIFWILTLPLLFTRYAPLCFLGLLATAVLGAAHIAKSKRVSDAVAFISISESTKRKKSAWVIWGFFFLVYVGAVAVVTFGSNIWFGHPLHISGPYQFANIASRFYLPILTIIIPITISGFSKLLIKNEKRYENV